MKIAIINDIHTGEILKRKGTIRASSHLIEDVLPKLLERIDKQHAPDLIINLGDLIRSKGKEEDLNRYQRAIGHFRGVDCPVLHLIGNHELKCMSIEDVENVWEEMGFHQKSYGLKEVGNITIVWLGIEHEFGKTYRLPFEQLNWLNEVLQHVDKPTLVCIHYAIDDHDVSGNFFYETDDAKGREAYFLENQSEIRRIIAQSGSVQAVLQAHLHYFHAKVIEEVPYITCPAMGDNICGPDMNDNVPEIYTLITLKPHQLTVKAYSRESCFTGAEFMT